MSLAYRKAMAERAEKDERECSLEEWLAEDGAPSPGAWVYSTVEGILRPPILAGMTPFNPGNGTKERGTNGLRDSDGLPVVDESLAILPVADRCALVAKLDKKDTGHSKPRALRTKASPLLSGLVGCGEHGRDGVRMHRCAAGPQRHGYT